MPHRDFDAARAERARVTDPETFTLGGETFTCVLAPAVGDVLDLIDAPEPEDNRGAAIRAAVRFVDTLLIPSDRERFAQVIRGTPADGVPVGRDDLFAVMAELGEAFSGRPTVPPDGSSSGRESVGHGSNGTGSPEPVSPSPTAQPVSA